MLTTDWPWQWRERSAIARATECRGRHLLLRETPREKRIEGGEDREASVGYTELQVSGRRPRKEVWLIDKRPRSQLPSRPHRGKVPACLCATLLGMSPPRPPWCPHHSPRASSSVVGLGREHLRPSRRPRRRPGGSPLARCVESITQPYRVSFK